MKTFILLSRPFKGIKAARCLLAVAILSGYSFTCFSQDKEKGVNIGIVYPISTHGTHAKEYSNIVSINSIAGVSRGEKAFAGAGVANLVFGNATGFQGAGFLNYIKGSATGFTGAGFINIYNDANGFQGAGYINIARGNVTGMQAAGFMNRARNSKGFQAAGLLNIADDVTGGQAAGVINIADNVTGTQAAGFINIAKKVKGVQISGFMNIADSSDYPIGIINLIRNGEKSIGLSVDDNLTTTLSFRSGGRKLYGILGAGYNFENDEETFAIQIGMGAHVITRNNFRLNIEATTISLENFESGEFSKFSLNILPALKLTPSLEIFGGPAVNYVDTNSSEGKKLVDSDLWNDTSRDGHLRSIYIGYTAGIHWIF